MEQISKNKAKRFQNRKEKAFRNSFPQTLEVARAIVVGVNLSPTVIDVNLKEHNDDGSLEVRIHNKQYRLVLQHIAPKFIVWYRHRPYEAQDFEQALSIYRSWLGFHETPKLESVGGDLTPEQLEQIKQLTA